MGDAEFKFFIRFSNQLVVAAEDFVREKNSNSVLIPTMSKDMDEQLKLARKVVDVVDRANKKNFVTLLRYNVDKPEDSYALVRLSVRKQRNEIFQQRIFFPI